MSMSMTTNKVSLMSIAAAMLLLLSTGLVCAEQRYADPGGRYSMPIPDGWQIANEQENGVTLVNGSAYAALATVKGRGTSKSLVKAVGGGFTDQWQDFDSANSADCKLAGQSGFCAWYTGINPRGVEAVLKISGLAADGWGYLLVTSAPREDFTANKAVFDGIERGFRLER